MDDQVSRQPLGAYRMPPWIAPPRKESKHLLMFAEELQSKREETMYVIRLHELKKQLLSLAVLLGVAFAGMLSFLWGTIEAVVPTLFVACYALPLLGVLAVWTAGRVSLADLKARLCRDERALAEVVALLRETKHRFAKYEGWSIMQEAEFRARLSRLESSPSNMRERR